MMEFRIRKRTEAGRDMPSEAEAQVVEVWNGQQVVAIIYPGDDSVRIVAPDSRLSTGVMTGPPAVALI